jgi:hypothetical protein
MSIITTIPLEVKQAQAKVKISQGINAAIMGLQDQMLRLFTQFWLNPELTPQQVADAFGTDAAQLFVLMGKAQAFINDVKPNAFVQSPPKAFVINQDGTVTIS